MMTLTVASTVLLALTAVLGVPLDASRDVRARWVQLGGRNDDSRIMERDASSSKFVMEDLYHTDSLLDWTYFDEDDPTHGLVDYQSKEDAQSKKLAYADKDGYTWFTVDDKATLNLGEKRSSVRVSSNKQYNVDNGSLIFIADVQSMPTGCSTWPAFWLLGGSSPWPNAGEVDIIEGVNNNNQNQISLHTSAGCTISSANVAVSGKPGNTQCLSVQGSNQGCSYFDPRPQSYGSGLVDGDGGVYATLWDADSGLKMWFFPGSKIPRDISSGVPNPEKWGDPTGFFSSETCSMDHFKDMSMIINTSICGDWAGADDVWAQSGCPATCEALVQDPKNFESAKWQINYIAAYRQTKP